MSSNPLPPLPEALTNLIGPNSPGQMMLYQIIQSMVMEALAPFLEQVRHIALSGVPVVPLSPSELADMVNRGIKTEVDAQPEAQFSGLNADRFSALVTAAGEAPGIEFIARALRLGIIGPDFVDVNTPSFALGVMQSRVRNIWGPMLNQVARAYPTPDLLVQAWLRGQTDENTARIQYEQLGGVPEWFDTQFNVAGRPPSPAEAAEMVHRGFIPPDGIGATVTSYAQAVRESDLKDKWGAAFFQLSEYLPPPRTVVALVRAGAMDDTTALITLQKSGVSADNAASYVQEAHATKTAADRNLAKGDVLQLYGDKIIGFSDAVSFLEALGYNQADAIFLTDMTDFRREASALNAAVLKIANLYIAYRLDYNGAVLALDELGIAATQRDALLKTWAIERTANVKLLTPSEVKKAYANQLLTQADALQRLINDGYPPAEATLYLAI